jgi:hypothetical protein
MMTPQVSLLRVIKYKYRSSVDIFKTEIEKHFNNGFRNGKNLRVCNYMIKQNIKRWFLIAGFSFRCVGRSILSTVLG